MPSMHSPGTRSHPVPPAQRSLGVASQALNLIIATALKRLSAVAFVIIGIVKDRR